MEDAMNIAIPMASERNNTITATIKALSKRLLGFIKQRVGSTEDAEDILQDVFYQFAGNTEPIEQASAWLFKVARNKITDSYRKQKLPLADDVLSGGDGEDDGFDWRKLYLRMIQTLKQNTSVPFFGKNCIGHWKNCRQNSGKYLYKMK